MTNPLNTYDAETRRHFVERCAKTALGLTILPAAPMLAEDTQPNTHPGFGRAKRVIVLQLNGGMSHIDTFDPKSGPSKGPGDAIKTSADFQVTEFLPKTAAIANKICVLRTMTAEVGVHKPAQYVIRTGYTSRGTVRHPNIGAWAQHYLGRSHKTMPSSVCVNRRSDQGNGFFPSSYAPLAIGKPDDGLSNIKALGNKKELSDRLSLLDSLDTGFRSQFNDKRVQAYNGYYEDAVALMSSRDLDAFDIGKETQAVRELYGDSTLGQGCLLARRLVSTGVRFVEVAHDGWDMHKNLTDDMTDLAPVFDQAYAALITDLDRLGMLDSTLVVVATEFGRKPEFSGDGRSHHPLCFSTLLAGGGIKRGYVHGESDSHGKHVKENPIHIGNFHATIGCAAGMPIHKPVVSPDGRPFTVGDKKQPIHEVFA